MWNNTWMIVAIATAAIWTATVATTAAQPNDAADIEAIIEGFDNESESSPETDAFLEGFEDSPAGGTDTTPAMEDLLQGFEETSTSVTDQADLAASDDTWQLEGELALTATYHFSPDAAPPWRGLSMLRPELDLALKHKFSDTWQGRISTRAYLDLVYALRGVDRYSAEVRREYERQIELKDTYVQGSLTNDLDLKLGRQIVVWGLLDNLRLTDVLNPLDLRLPGLTDIEDLRLAVTMAKVDYYRGPWDLSLMAIPEVRFSKLPVFGSDFFPASRPLPPEQVPADGVAEMQFAAAVSGVFSGWDLRFYGADVYADQAHIELDASGSAVRKHARIMMLGWAAGLAVGDWIFKAETAWFDGLRFTNTPGIDYDRFDSGGGVEYSGFDETTISFECVNRHLFDFDPLLKQSPDAIRVDQLQWALRLSRDFMHDALTANLLVSVFGLTGADGALQRLDAEYELTDALSVRAGMVLYQSGSLGRLADVDANDRLFVEIRFSF